MTHYQLFNAGVKLRRCERNWIDPISGYHASRILEYILRGADALETPQEVRIKASALLWREGFPRLAEQIQ